MASASPSDRDGLGADAGVDDVRVHTPIERGIAWVARYTWPPRRYALTRTLIVRLLGVVVAFAFLGILRQGLPLLGSHGLTPVATLVDRLHAAGKTFWDVPSVFMWDASDGALVAWAYVGLALSLAMIAGYANLPSMLVLWLVAGSYERVGQLWWSFGWEIQLVETLLLVAALVHPWDPRPLAARPPPVLAIVLVRWLVFRIMLGAGLIKLRGDACWRELTCLDWHFETQPIPNPLSPWMHHLPHAVHATGVAFNHVVELAAPWFVFGPRRLRLVAGTLMALFQIVLIVSGNLAFLNWLTLVPILACFDDDALLALAPARARAWVVARVTTREPSRAHRYAVIAYAVVVAIASLPVIDNLLSKHQRMNSSFDRLALVNTYGAFGSVGDVRHELVIEGTMDGDPETAHWRAYELPCKPGDPDRGLCVLGPYHRRLDWLIWFAAMEEAPSEHWILHVVWKLLDGDRGIRRLFAVDPFDGAKPRWVRIQRYVYRFARGDEPGTWVREHEAPWLLPVALDTPDLVDALRQVGLPSPTDRGE